MDANGRKCVSVIKMESRCNKLISLRERKRSDNIFYDIVANSFANLSIEGGNIIENYLITSVVKSF